MSDIRIGIIGVGSMGSGHARYLTDYVDGAIVTALFDLDQVRMKNLADELSIKSKVLVSSHNSVESLVKDPNVDAVIICSPDWLHPEHLTSAIAAGKHVLCEKPLASKSSDAKRIVELANKSGLIVAVGFMRRFDNGFIALKKEIDSGKYGKLLQLRATSRNVSSPNATTAGLLSNVCVHDIDFIRWLTGEEVATVSTIKTRRTSFANDQLQDPLSVIVHTQSGLLMSVDIAANNSNGYEVGVEALMEKGSLVVENLGQLTISSDFNLPARAAGKLYEDWIGRFKQAYIDELRAWVASIKSGVLDSNLATPNDGLAASIACEIGIASLS